MARRRPIPEGDKKAIALGLGCLPGGCVAISCDWCEAAGGVAWPMPKAGRGRIFLRCGFEWDHHVPISRGGDNGLGNIWPICRACNRKKGAKTSGEFARVMYPELRS